jgi:hypothetical protein
MVGKAFRVEPQRKAVMLVCHPCIMVVIGVGAFLLFIGETVGTAQELPTGTNQLVWPRLYRTIRSWRDQ